MEKSYFTQKVRVPWLGKMVVLFMMLLFAFHAKAQTYECGSDHIHKQKMQNDPTYAAKMKQYENKVLQRNNSSNNFQTMSTLTTPYKIPVVVHVMQDSTDLTVISKEVIRREILRLNQRMRKIAGSLGDGSGVDTGFEFVLAVRDPNGASTDGILYHDLSDNPTYVSQGVKFQSTDAGITEMALKNTPGARWNTSQYYNIWLVNKIGGGNPDTAGGYAASAGAHGQDGDGSVILTKQFNSLDAVTAHELGHAFNLKHTFEGSNGSNCPPAETTVSEFITIAQMVPANQGETFIASATSGKKYYVSQVFIQNNGGFASQQQINSWGTSSLPAGVHYINKTQHLLIQTSNGSQRYFIHKNYFLIPGNQIPEITWLDDWNPYDLEENVYAVAVGQQQLEHYPSNHCNQSGDRVCDTPRHQKTLNCNDSNSCEADSSVVKNYMSYATGFCQNEFTQGQKSRMVEAMQLRKSFLASEGNMSLVPVINPVADFVLPAATICIGSTLKLYDISKNIPNTFLDVTSWQGISFVWTVVKEGVTTHTTYQQNPALTFNALGNYAITLTVTNQNGTHSKTQQLKVVAPIAIPAVCAAPGSHNPSSNYGFSINNVTFNTLNNSTDLDTNGVYKDYSCENGSTTVDAGAVYSLKVSVKSGSVPYRFEAYIDWNNNGTFEYPGEMVADSIGTQNQNSTFDEDITIPDDAVMGTLLRMRIIADNAEITAAKRNCTQVFALGDTEDYGIFINGTPVCPQGNVTFTTQEQVNQFAATYPNCTQISGYLAIANSSGATAITNLAPLNGLTGVGGSLDINTNASLANLNGLHNIANIGGDLNIKDNPALTNVDALSNLTGIDGFLVVMNNAALNNISGLQNVNPATIGGNNGLTIINNPQVSVCNLPNFCTYLGGNGIKNISGNAGNCTSVPGLTAVCYPPVCPEGSVTFNTQAQIDQFAVDYPNCTAVSGTLLISGSDITNLAPLNGITNVGGNLYINNTPLSNLNGLHNIITVSGDIDISNNATLTTLDGLSSLTNALGNLVITQNATLTNVDALSSLTNINGHLVIYNNAALTSVSGLQNLNPNSIQGEYGLYIANNPQLSVCNNINFCVYLLSPANTRPRTISGNAADCISEQALSTICNPTPAQCPTGDVALTTQAEVNQFVASYPNCTTITGDLRIGVVSGTSNITDISQLSHLVTVTGTVFISYNDALQNLIGLDGLANVGGLYIQNNGLMNLNGLSGLTNTGNLVIENNLSLTNINGLGGLTSVAGSVKIQNNNTLTNVNGLNNLTNVSGLLTIQDNNTLSNISGLQNVNPATLVPMDGFGLTIKNNPVLSVCNLPNLCTYLANVSNPRDIAGNAANCISAEAITTACTSTPVNNCPTGTINFTSQAQVNQFLIDYPNCTEITGSVVIGNNPTSYPAPTTNINSLAPLSNITKIGGNLSIDRNPALQNLNGLNNLVHIGGDVLVRAHGTTFGNSTTYPQLPLVGLNNLTSIGGDVLFSRINKFNGLENLTTVGGDLTIGSAYAGVTPGNMNGFSSLTTVGGTLFIGTRAYINNLDGLGSLTSTGGLYIQNDNSITNVNGLSNLTSVGGGAIIIQPVFSDWYNNSLTDVSGLQNVNPGTISDIHLISNKNLAICDLPNFCTYLSNPANPRSIYGNKPSCNLNALLNTCATQIVCPTDSVYIYAQEDLDNFALEYPNCTQIIGDVEIVYGDDITDISALSNITFISGNLKISNPSLSNVDGLSSLAHIGGDLTLEQNNALNNLNGLDNLMSIGGSLKILANPFLSDTSALNAVQIIGQSVEFLNNPLLTDLNWLNNVTTIGGNFSIQHSPNLIGVSGFANLEAIDGYLSMSYNDSLSHLDGLGNLASVGGHMSISDGVLTNLSGLSNLQSVGGELSIWTTTLSNLNDLQNLTSIGSLSIAYNYSLTSLSGLQNVSLSNVGEEFDMYINGNPLLSICNLPNICNYLDQPAMTHPRIIAGNFGNCLNEAAVVATCSNTACPTGNVTLSTQTQVDQFVSSYPNCSQISGNLSIDGTINSSNGMASMNDSDAITDISGLSNIQTITGQLNIVHNPELSDLSGLNSVKSVSGNLWIADNTSLSNINNTFNSLETTGQLYIGYNPSLYSVGQFGSLISVTSDLTIEHNPGVSELNGFSNLTTVGGATRINNNAGLGDISGLQNINAATLNNLVITNNPLLSVCNQSNICAYLAGSGARTIVGNSGSCATELAVSNTCSLSISDNDFRKISYYPNPVQDILYLTHHQTIDQVSVVNILGQTIIAQKVGSNKAELDLSKLAVGNYFVKVTSDTVVQTIKIIKK